MRQSFLPGFDVPFVLVDVELPAQEDLRLIGRLVDGPDAALASRCRSVTRLRGHRAGRFRAGVRAVANPMSGRMEASNHVAIVGYAQSPVSVMPTRRLVRSRWRRRGGPLRMPG